MSGFFTNKSACCKGHQEKEVQLLDSKCHSLRLAGNLHHCKEKCVSWPQEPDSLNLGAPWIFSSPHQHKYFSWQLLGAMYLASMRLYTLYVHVTIKLVSIIGLGLPWKISEEHFQMCLKGSWKYDLRHCIWSLIPVPFSVFSLTQVSCIPLPWPSP